ncbi:carboxylate-amine ligase [Streptomyces sp. PTD5-9]|uniref:carboxylate-amine ligase n=1 Tax=Streptomyces sp. PTD5-9 TaxID=3120150 RepID=UPI00300A44A9
MAHGRTNQPHPPDSPAPADPLRPVAPPEPLDRGDDAPLTFGVEEEFLLLDPETGHPVPEAPVVLRDAAPAADGTLTEEITRFQLEAATPVCRSASQAHRHLAAARRALADSAARLGLGLVAAGCAPHGAPGALPLTDRPRYRRIDSRFGALSESYTVCGCHIHVGMPDLPTALAVSNHLRPHLPTLLAMSANSPFYRGRDTGHASWRNVLWSRLPSAGPPPLYRTPEDYHRAVGALLSGGAALDRGMVYWFIRPAPRLPTLEIRVADVAATAEEALLLALLVRGLAATALRAVAEGRPAAEPSDGLLRLALWRAAHDGLEGNGLDPATGAPTPARVLLDRTVRTALPGLDASGDTAVVAGLVDRLLRCGSGAHRQRAAHARDGRISDVTALLVEQTRTPLPA